MFSSAGRRRFLPASCGWVPGRTTNPRRLRVRGPPVHDDPRQRSSLSSLLHCGGEIRGRFKMFYSFLRVRSPFGSYGKSCCFVGHLVMFHFVMSSVMVAMSPLLFCAPHVPDLSLNRYLPTPSRAHTRFPSSQFYAINPAYPSSYPFRFCLQYSSFLFGLFHCPVSLQAPSAPSAVIHVLSSCSFLLSSCTYGAAVRIDWRFSWTYI